MQQRSATACFVGIRQITAQHTLRMTSDAGKGLVTDVTCPLKPSASASLASSASTCDQPEVGSWQTGSTAKQSDTERLLQWVNAFLCGMTQTSPLAHAHLLALYGSRQREERRDGRCD